MRKALSYTHIPTPGRPRCDMCDSKKKRRAFAVVWLSPVGESRIDDGLNLCRQHSKLYNFKIVS